MIRDNDTGLLRKLKIEERICRGCEENNILDELYFLLTCPQYQIPRNLMLNQILNKHCNIHYLGNNEDRSEFIMTNCWKKCVECLQDS